MNLKGRSFLTLLDFSPEEMKKVFSRYNANTRKITAYGEEVYNYYLCYGRREENA